MKWSITKALLKFCTTFHLITIFNPKSKSANLKIQPIHLLIHTPHINITQAQQMKTITLCLNKNHSQKI